MSLKILLLAASLALASCLVPQSIEEQREITQEAIQSHPDISQSRYLETDGFRIQYRQVGNAELGIVLWVHGTPGGWSNAVRLMLNEDFTTLVKIISVDRPGWGESQHLDDPRLFPDFADQARLIFPLLRKLKADNPEQPIILAGHSWGGSLVPVIALEYPELVDGVVIVAGGLDPELTSPRWYNRLGNTWLAQGLLDERMEGANREVYALQPQLEALKTRWSEVQVPVLGIQGDRDGLVHPDNLAFIANHFPHSHVVMLEDQGHLLQAERPALLADCIISMLKEALASCEDVL